MEYLCDLSGNIAWSSLQKIGLVDSVLLTSVSPEEIVGMD